MPALPGDLRSKLERTVIEARDVAEAGARAALEALAVHHHEPYPHQTPEQRKLRNHLRARARQLGDAQTPKGELSIGHLAHECAYEHWHRMLFARFLAENDLLIEPSSSVAISLQECEELAKEAKTDLWTYASRCAQQMLPQIFRPDDPLLQVVLAGEHRLKLEHLLAGLDQAIFKADDSLGWVYQFWQSKKKDEVNASGEKITGDTLPAVTQLFTEHYMVLFLLHNTVGAWHAGKVLAANPTLADSATSEEQLRQAVSLSTAGGYSFDYLRFVRGPSSSPSPGTPREGRGEGPWRPASGTFEGWPKRAAQIKLLDPCCGSGHFDVAGFELLVRLRMHEEGLSLPDAIGAVLRDNIYGLELDGRCTQIAAFNLALAVWKLAGFRKLLPLNIASTGIGPQATREQWLKLAEQSRIPMPALGREPIKNGLLNLHRLFSQAPTLGSLINPTELPADLITADYETLQPYLTAALSAETADDETRERAIAAQGMVKAAELLAGSYTLVITNVPYLGRGKQDDALKAHLEKHYKEGKADLATAFVLRCLELCQGGSGVPPLSSTPAAGSRSHSGTAVMVTPQNWLFLTTYTKLRESLLKQRTWNVVARLGPGAFETIGGHVVNVALLALSATKPGDAATMIGIDVSAAKQPAEKAALLRGELPAEIAVVPQAEQLKNPAQAITIGPPPKTSTRLGDFVDCYHGITTTDYSRFGRRFWEVLGLGDSWLCQQSTVDVTTSFGGRSSLLLWRNNGEDVRAMRDAGATVVITGLGAWHRQGVAVSQMNNLAVTRFTGDAFDTNVAVVVPRREEYLPAVWTFLSSDDFPSTVRRYNSKVVVDYVYYPTMPFDLAHWQKMAAEKYPNGLPEPESDDPTQWLFHGRPEVSTAPLQVAVARLLSYRWPAELDDEMRLSKGARELVKRCDELLTFADDDGIVCIPSVRGEEPAPDRLLAVLTASGITPNRDLDDWLRNDFFKEHCELFHQRPFIWHIWDGRKRDGFHALVNYHKLAEGSGKGRRLLESLTYAYLGEWIARQQDGVKGGEDGAEDRLAAAVELQKRLTAILEGEPPFDLFVRWKPLHEQPIGWDPDIDDGVRINIRPFMASDLSNGRAGAGVLRWKPNIKWEKDRGKEPERAKSDFPWFWGWDGKTVDFTGGRGFTGERFNDCHYTVAAKRRAREATGKS